MSYQTIILVGNLGKEPEMRFTPQGNPVTNMSVATNRTYEQNGEKITETCWFKVTVWGNQAEACNQYLRKGSRVLVEGRLTPDKATGGPKVWTSQNGVTGASYEVIASVVRFLSSKGENEGEDADGVPGDANEGITPPSTPAQRTSAPVAPKYDPMDDIPF